MLPPRDNLGLGLLEFSEETTRTELIKMPSLRAPSLSILTNSGGDNGQECGGGEEAREMNIYVEC